MCPVTLFVAGIADQRGRGVDPRERPEQRLDHRDQRRAYQKRREDLRTVDQVLRHRDATQLGPVTLVFVRHADRIVTHPVQIGRTDHALDDAISIAPDLLDILVGLASLH